MRSRTYRLAYLPGPDEARALAEKKRLALETQIQKLRRREAESKEFYTPNRELEQDTAAASSTGQQPAQPFRGRFPPRLLRQETPTDIYLLCPKPGYLQNKDFTLKKQFFFANRINSNSCDA